MSLWKQALLAGGVDIIPDQFIIPDATGVNPSTVCSAVVTPVSFDAPIPWAVNGSASARTNSVATYATSGMILPGESLTIHQTSSASYDTGITVMVIIGIIANTWLVKTRPIDLTPDSFVMADVFDKERSTTFSGSVTPSGYDTSIPWSITGGNGSGVAKISGGTFATSGTISPGQTLIYSGTSSNTFSTILTFNLVIGGVTGAWQVGTRPIDALVDSYNFADIASAEVNQVRNATITPTGYEATLPWTITGGDGTGMASVAGGAYAVSGTISPGQSMTVRATSNVAYSTTDTYLIDIGGITDSWSIVTRPIDLVISAFNFTDITAGNISQSYTATVTPTSYDAAIPWMITGGNGTGMGSVAGGAYATSGTISPGQTLTIRATSNSAYSTTDTYAVDINGVMDNWVVTTRPPDITPDLLSFPTVSGIVLNTQLSSVPAVINGIEVPITCTISGGNGTGYLSIDGGPQVTSGTVSAGQTVTLYGTTAGTYATLVGFSVSAGAVNRTWYVRTDDPIPDQFYITDASNVALSQQCTATFTPTGYDVPLAWSVSGGNGTAQASVGGGSYVTSGTITAGSGAVTVRATASNAYSTAQSFTFTVGTVSDTWTITTRPIDLTPDAFNFSDVYNANFSTIGSASITPTGYDTAVACTISGGNGTGRISIAGGPQVTSGSVSPGQSVTVYGTASSSASTSVGFDIYIGGVYDSWSIVTRSLDSVPDAFNLSDVNNASASQQFTTSFTPTGYEAVVTCSISGGNGTGQLSTNNSSYSTSVTISPGQTLYVRGNASSFYGTGIGFDVYVGGVYDQWVITTRNQDLTVDQFYFSDIAAASPNQQCTASVTPTGYEASVYWYISGGNGSGQGSVSGGAYATSGYISPGQSLTIIASAPSSGGSTDTYTIYINGVYDYWAVTANAPSGEATYTSPGMYNMTVPAGVYSMSAVGVGGGGTGYNSSAAQRWSGAGGSLGYINNFSVTPGQNIVVVVSAAQPGGNWTGFSLNNMATWYTLAWQGSNVENTTGGAIGGSAQGGGEGGEGCFTYNGYASTGGGGAGGYAGKGGRGSPTSGDTQANNPFGYAGNGQGGAGGGGCGGGTVGGSGGGGVGIYGIGLSGAVSNSPYSGGQGGSNGSAGNIGYQTGDGKGWGGHGGGYGGGAGSGSYGNNLQGPNGTGAGGAARFIWGSGRSFPYNAS
jgi:hypothetical protein